MRTARSSLAAAGALVILLATAPGVTSSAAQDDLGPGLGRIEGDIRIVTAPSRRLATPGAYPNRQVTLAPRRGSAETENVVVFVANGRGVTKPRAGHAAVRQRNEEFLPHVIAITAGSTVEFPNDDPFFHNVFSLSSIATFDLGRYPQGASRQRPFNRPGLVKVFCHLHSHMSAVVRVFDHPYFTKADADGRFSIDGIAAGRYNVVAWHERVGEISRDIVVAAGQATNVSWSMPLKDGE